MAKVCKECGAFFSNGFEMEGQTATDDDRFCSEECKHQYEADGEEEDQMFREAICRSESMMDARFDGD